MLSSERRWLVVASLGTTLLVFLFFILAPVAGYPMVYSDALGIVQILVPVFTGYLGTAAQFAFSRSPKRDTPIAAAAKPLIKLMVRGPIVVFVIIIVASIVAFGISNGADAPVDSGMSVSLLSAIVTASLALLTVTTNAAVAYLFDAQEEKA